MRGKRWVGGAANHGCWLGTYEYREQRLFARTIRPGAVVYDVGANVDFYTLLAAVSAGTNGRVYAFELLPRNVAFLHRRLRRNQVQTVDIPGGRLFGQRGVGDLRGRRGSLNGSPRAGCRLAGGDGEPGRTGVCPRAPQADVINVDIEGGELRALQGARRLLETRHPLIFLSTHGHVVHEQCCTLLTDLGYRLTGVDGRAVPVTDELVARLPTVD